VIPYDTVVFVVLDLGQEYGGNRQGNEQVASFLAPLGEEPGASRDLALWPI
jgi:hypothetical protein